MSPVQADRLAVEASRTEAFRCLARAVGHDINNILTSLSLATAKMKQHADPVVAQCARDFAHAVELVNALAKQLLELDGAVQVTVGSTDIRRLLGREYGKLNALPAGRATLTIEDHGGCAVVRMSANELEQMLLNLVANARDSIAGSGHVRNRAP